VKGRIAANIKRGKEAQKHHHDVASMAMMQPTTGSENYGAWRSLVGDVLKY